MAQAGEESSAVQESSASTPDDSDVYRMDHKTRGHFIIINNETFDELDKRTGSDIDEKSLSETFEELGFEVHKHKNMEKEDMLKLMMKGELISCELCHNLAFGLLSKPVFSLI